MYNDKVGLEDYLLDPKYIFTASYFRMIYGNYGIKCGGIFVTNGHCMLRIKNLQKSSLSDTLIYVK